MATLSTKRDCPYCASEIELGDCPIVATSVKSEFEEPGRELVHPLGEDLAATELHSGMAPLRLLAKTNWPVLKEAPRDARAEAIGRRRGQSGIEQAFADLTGRGGGNGVLPPVHEDVGREDLPARACPECDFPLPESIDSRPAVLVAVIGVNRVGKTHMLASSLAQAYRERGLAAIGCTEFVPDESTGERFLDHYYNPLFRRGEVLERTQANEDARFLPLVFNVTLDGVEPFSLVLHDVAGELLADRRARARAAGFLHGAKGVVFVIDPRDIDELRDGVEPLMAGEEDLGWDQGTLLAACLGHGGMLDVGRPVPVAVAVAKADLLPQATGEALPFLDRHPPAESKEELYSRIRATSRQVESFLDARNAHNILGPARDYRRRLHEAGGEASVTFHAFSALGRHPDEVAASGGKVQPINCLDPLAAILSQV
ncbi:MAG TPA: hypothetical protein VFC52_02345 [Solirubrobacterales bacterium]|nr:hypothetical protein [Solirubrobacterales bacterium]